MRYFADYIKGKPYQKTVLWENSSPTSDFASQAVTLSDDITNYDVIRFTYKDSKSGTDIDYIETSVADFLETVGGASFIGFVSSQSYCRRICFSTITEISFSNNLRLNASGTSNSTNIPLKIIGIKKGLGETAEPIATPLTVVTGTGSYTLNKDYKYLFAYTWSNDGSDYTNVGRLNDKSADARINQNYSSVMVWYNVKKNDVYTNVSSATIRLIGLD